MKILVSGNSFSRQFSRFALEIFFYIYFTIFKMFIWSNLIYECVSFISTECQWSVQNPVLHYGNNPWLIIFYILLTYPLRRAFLRQRETSPDSCSLTKNCDNSIFFLTLGRRCSVLKTRGKQQFFARRILNMNVFFACICRIVNDLSGP